MGNWYTVYARYTTCWCSEVLGCIHINNLHGRWYIWHTPSNCGLFTYTVLKATHMYMYMYAVAIHFCERWHVVEVKSLINYVENLIYMCKFALC